MSRRILLALAAVSCLASCATPYRPPVTPPPPAWDGAFGYAPVGEATVREGTIRVGEAIISQPVKYVRTGVIAETVQTKGAYGGPLILPKGAKAYATNYSLTNNYVAQPMQGIQKRIDPIEWCVILEAGKDGQQAEPETVCLLYENAERARYMETYDKGGFPFEPFLGEATGMAGPLPVINEQPVDFPPLRTELRVREIDNGRLELAHVLTDGKDSRIFDRKTYRLGGGGGVAVKVAGHAVIIGLAAPDAIQVTAVPLPPPPS